MRYSTITILSIQLLCIASCLAAPTSHKRSGGQSHSPDPALKPDVYNHGDYVRVTSTTLRDSGKHVPTAQKVSPHPGIIVGGPHPDPPSGKGKYDIAMITQNPKPGRPIASAQQVHPGTPVNGHVYLHKPVRAPHEALRLWTEKGSLVPVVPASNLQNLRDEMRKHESYESPSPSPTSNSGSSKSKATDKKRHETPTEPRSHRQGGTSTKKSRFHPYQRNSHGTQFVHHPSNSQSGNHGHSLSLGAHHISNSDGPGGHYVNAHASSSWHPQAESAGIHHSVPRYGRGRGGRSSGGTSPRSRGQGRGRRAGERRSLSFPDNRSY